MPGKEQKNYQAIAQQIERNGKDWAAAEEAKDSGIVSLLDQAVQLFCSTTNLKERDRKVIDFFEEEGLDLPDLFVADRRVGDYLRSKPELNGKIGWFRRLGELGQIVRMDKQKNTKGTRKQQVDTDTQSDGAEQRDVSSDVQPQNEWASKHLAEAKAIDMAISMIRKNDSDVNVIRFLKQHKINIPELLTQDETAYAFFDTYTNKMLNEQQMNQFGRIVAEFQKKQAHAA